MQGWIPGWKPTSKWLIIAKQSDGDFPFEYIDARYETWNEEVVI